MKLFATIVIVLIVIAGGMFFWQNRQTRKAASVEVTPAPTIMPSISPSPSATPVQRSITLITPVNNETLLIGKTATVSGQAVGLFEGNVVIQLTDKTGKMLLQKPITVSDWMQPTAVDWSATIIVPASASAGLAKVTVVNPSAKDSSEDVSDTVTVVLK